MDDKVLWFITVFEKSEQDDLGWPHMGASRCWGFYENKSDALLALYENRTDLWEGCYHYAVLEAYHPGISGYAFEYGRQFFQYDKEHNGYFEIDEPAVFKHTCSFGIG